MSLPLRINQLGGPVILAIISVILFYTEPASGELLAYQRYAIEGMETWRIITGNLVHTNGYHLLLNLTGLLILWALHGNHYQIIQFSKLFIWCCIGTSAGIYYFSPDLIWYAGLSGALHGIFIWGSCMDIRKGIKSGWLLLVGVIIKLVIEQYSGSSEQVASLIDAKVAVDAHLYGAISGLSLFFLMWFSSLLSRTKRKTLSQ